MEASRAVTVNEDGTLAVTGVVAVTVKCVAKACVSKPQMSFVSSAPAPSTELQEVPLPALVALLAEKVGAAPE